MTKVSLLMAVVGVSTILLRSGPTHAQAGPPFLSNDPGTPGSNNWEINIAGAGSVGRRAAAYQAPQIDLNFGLSERIQLTYEIPYAVQTQTGQPTHSGWSNAFVGGKWRFLDQGEGGWQASLFPQMETNAPASAQRKGIATAGPRWLMPLEVTRRVGPLDVDVDVGYYLPRDGVRERILGVVAGRSLSERFDLAAELYDDRVDGGAPGERTLDVGGRFKLRRGFIALFMAGHTVGSTGSGPQFVGYIGIQILLSDYGRTLERDQTPVIPAGAR